MRGFWTYGCFCVCFLLLLSSLWLLLSINDAVRQSKVNSLRAIFSIGIWVALRLACVRATKWLGYIFSRLRPRFVTLHWRSGREQFEKKSWNLAFRTPFPVTENDIVHCVLILQGIMSWGFIRLCHWQGGSDAGSYVRQSYSACIYLCVGVILPYDDGTYAAELLLVFITAVAAAMQIRIGPLLTYLLTCLLAYQLSPPLSGQCH